MFVSYAAVLDQIQDEWGFVMDDDFNPVDLALQLLDDSSVGKDLDSFLRTKRMLERSLKSTVDKHYQAFAAALPHHSALVSSMSTTQAQVSEARTKLQEAKDALSSKRADLVQLWSRGQTVEEMIKILDEIDRLKSVPDQLESLMAEKRLLQAAILLVRSLKSINKGEMQEIGAVSDLRSYLNGQETALREILIDELHSHLYLKTFWCDSRWAAYTPDQQILPAVPFDEIASIGTSNGEKLPSVIPSSRGTKLSRFLHSLAMKPNENPLDLAESDPTSSNAFAVPSSPTASTSAAGQPDKNPESDSFAYIETLLESLAVLAQLGSALDVVAQRLPVEVYTLVETTIEEVSDRAEFAKRASTILQGGRPLSMDGSGKMVVAGAVNMLRMAALESPAKDADREVLRDLFWTLYSKLDAVVQGLRVVYEVANRIGSRRDFKDSSGAKVANLFPLVEIWTPLQGEIRTLLRDYIATDESVSSSRNPIASIQEVLRDGRSIRPRDKQLFRFTESDAKATTRSLKKYEDELTRTLKETVPGLVQGTSETAVQTTLSSFGSSDRFNIAGQHMLVVKADAFHVAVLFQPTLVFLNRVVEVLPPGMADSAKDSGALLDEFVLSIFLPQLEERVDNLFHHAVTGADAFQVDTTAGRLSAQPLLKCTTQLMALTNSLCIMMRATPFHRENYARLILGVIIQFYQRCSERFRDLVSPDDLSVMSEEHLALSFQWAQRPEVSACLSALDSVEPNSPEMVRICRQETRVELNFQAGKSIKKTDIIHSTRNIAALGNLYHSLTWFIGELYNLKSLNEELLSPGPLHNLEPPLSAITPLTPFVPPVPPPAAKSDDSLRLPLSREMTLRFDALLKTYTQLTELILYTIRIDIRCRTIYYLDLAMRTGNYKLDTAATEPDPYIVDLNADLTACDDAVTASLPQKQRIFVFEGLGLLIEHLLISHARSIRFANSFGIQKIQRNILAMQQNLKTIMDGPLEAELERAKKYYSLFSLAPARLLAGIRQRAEFTFDEYKTILNFQYGIDQSLSETAAAQSDREYNMHLIDLHALAIDMEDDAD
ncbi:hypothetical protein EXIGLDRAFT_612626 [Exidia glandulosa HHB12029]|uniref:Exocyst complex component Sec8 n=1 Tax=Exidia glandulosa HHB12029 TaxID=1314781 RepID=A0A165IRM2_EXIGL|nr:hypothetical protein EXIGLDRAFT_612626 [Exidia glandulosa HHB12029]